MRAYKKRHIHFSGIELQESWKIKYYKIGCEENFQALDYFQYVKSQVPLILRQAVKHHHEAFVVVHEASDGIWTIISWWTGVEMLMIQTYFSSSSILLELIPLKERGALACVWEMAVVSHEREAWIQHVLKESSAPDFERYEEDVIDAWI
ncbi:MAG: hypothetical protein JKY48_02965 [Flavobacteriales bacterium]|nr:hypothetical protein [Flavobacteriales bacterium]